MKIIEWDMSTRTNNALSQNNIETVQDLCALSVDEAYKLRNMGRMSFEEILSNMKQRNLTFNYDK